MSLAAYAAAADIGPSQPSQEDVVGRYLAAVQEQQLALRGVSMDVDINARLPKLKQYGRLHALRQISGLGKVTYRMIGFSGDNSVKKEVIARYLSAETQVSDGSSIAITPENYRFHFKGLRDEQGRGLYVVELSPRRKQVGLFKGELWLDPATCMPVREAGRFVKSPSVFLKKMEFVRLYDSRSGVAVPQHLESLVETRIFGPVELSIDFHNPSQDSD